MLVIGVSKKAHIVQEVIALDRVSCIYSPVHFQKD